MAGARWFARFEGRFASPAERFLVVLIAYTIGGLGYIGVNRLAGEGPFHTLDLPIDHAIPFIPTFVFAYVLVYVTPAFAGIFLCDRAELYRTFLAFTLNAILCFPFFLIYPVAYPRLLQVPDSIAGHLLHFVHYLDRPVNCFPSHHVSTAFTTFFVIRRMNARWGALFGGVACLIAISTLFVKQHYIVDVPAGILVAILTYYLAFPRTPLATGRQNAGNPS